MSMLGRVTRFLWSLLAMVLIAVVIPYMLVSMGRWRFGSARPWEGLEFSNLIDQVAVFISLSGRITDQMLVDFSIRLLVTVGWLCVVLLLVSVTVEVLHQLREGGRPAPRIRSLGWSQTLARSIAGGLLLVMPMQGITSAWGGESGSAMHLPASGVVFGVGHISDTDVLSQPVNHRVVSGETLWEIAEDRLGDPLRWKEIWALNQGDQMVDGRRFEDPHLILPGWVLHLPSDSLPLNLVPATALLPTGTSQKLVTPEAPLGALAEALAALGETEWLERNRTHAGWEMDFISPSSSDAGSGDASSGDASSGAADEVDNGVWSEQDQAADTEVAREGISRLNEDRAQSSSDLLLRLSSATMLATGLVVAMAARRRQRLRSTTAEMRPVPIDRLLTDRYLGGFTTNATIDPAEAGHGDGEINGSELADDPVTSGIQIAQAVDRILRIDLVLRIAAAPLVAIQQAIAAVYMSDAGEIEVVATAEVTMDRPWRGSGRRWKMPAQIGIDRLMQLARGLDPPCPALIHIGNSPDGRELYVDLEVLGVVSVTAEFGGAGKTVVGEGKEAVEEILRAVQLTLQNSIFGHNLDLWWVGAQDHLEMTWSTTLGAVEVRSCRGFDELTQLLDAQDPQRLRVVVVSSALDLADAPDQLWLTETVVIGHGMVRASGAHLVGDRNGWTLNGPVFEGLKIPVIPVGVSQEEAQELVDLIEEESQQPLLVYHAEHLVPEDGPDHSAAGTVSLHLVGSETPVTASGRRGVTSGAVEPSARRADSGWELMVRLMGTVDVVDTRGEIARFERSKSLELLAWCVTHRGRSTRTAARTALWELNVRDATFANVVSEARRATAALVGPELNRDWIRRTLTEELVLDVGITSDVEIMRATLDRADQVGVGEVVPDMEAALALIRGMPCEGSNFLWPEAEGISSDLILVATSLAASLAMHRLTEGDVTGVFRATAAGLLALPGHEELIALRMRAHAAAGDLAGVKQEWVAYQRVIARDPWSGGEPAPKLRDLSIELLGMKV